METSSAHEVTKGVQPRVGWIGLGSMGQAMALNLQKHMSKTGAPNIRYYNRTVSRGIPLQEIGGVGDAALEDTVDAIILSGDTTSDLRGKIIVDASTVHPASSTRAASRLAGAGVEFVAAPVSGASPVAAQGRLLWIAAGSADAVRVIKPFVVGVMGRDLIYLGKEVYLSSLMKAASNFLTAGMMELIAEAHVFAEKTGLGSMALEGLLQQEYGDQAHAMSRRLTTGVYMPALGERPWSDVSLAVKDVRIGVECAVKAGSRLEIGQLALSHLEEAKRYSDAVGRPLDSSSLYGALRQLAGLSFETDRVKARDGGAQEP
ncbi:NAD binding domain of 6-phosphogluconate dehydrogenase [Hirsutella rhossiliensis]|uniref:NAD binding domain of 6-phosphogluconate dehydrogenase n=1 Tax=Hirsutella rhossiliensis TaxID=111463 RepID=A0A9P8SD83_9HYPO|nr:NAD binding domain of 6-phosphogluconate dehydrogenase [Hirsutella rhossiliensis]KAH0957679.1 NAD binding domain of 6-phosphogluconate dehydrogenase [Hirsutella rhossiliensis]